MTDKGKKILKWSLLLLVAVFFIYLVVSKVDWQSFVQGLKSTRWGYVALFALASVLALVFRSERWRCQLLPFDGSLGHQDVWDATTVGSLANLALPGIGEFIKCGLISTKKATYDKTMGTIMMERVCDLACVVLLLFLALALKWKDFGGFVSQTIVEPLSAKLQFSLWWLVAAVLLFIAAVLWLIWRFRNRSAVCGKVWGVFRGLGQGFASIGKMEHKWLFLVYTAGLWLTYITMSWLGLKAIPVLSDLHFVDALFISSVGNIASVIPVPSSMGPYHYLVMTSLSSLYFCSQETGLLYAVLCHEVNAIARIAVGVVSYASLMVRKRSRINN